MNLQKLLLTKNNCYIANQKITPKAIMVHSTGANNPTLKRYIGPDDGLLGENIYGNHWNTPLPGGSEVCVHAFIGKLADGSVATYQTLPWDINGWHAGGSANNTHIGFEICEDDLTGKDYFDKVYKEATEFCVYLCKEFGLTEQNIICHSEGASKGIASGHADVMHWFPRHGKSMDTFREDVRKLLEEDDISSDNKEETNDDVLYRVQTGAFANYQNAVNCEQELKDNGYDTFMVMVNDLYKVQVGAFSIKDNAENMAKQLEEDGFNTYITTNGGTAINTEIVKPLKSIDEIAKEVILGKWGNGSDRVNRLKEAGYDASAVQKRVNELLL